MAKIAVISDLHVGPAARSSELNPHVVSDPDGFLEAFRNFTEREGVDADILIVPGDISDKAHPAEYELATAVIKQVADSLKVEHSKVFPVLGNHDLNWALIKAIEGGGDIGRELRFEPVRRSAWLCERLGSPNALSQLDEPYLCIDETADIFIVRYNSAESDLPDVKPHRGAILQGHLAELRQRLSDNPPPQDKVRIFVTHHHPQIYSDPIPDFPDFSSLVNAENLLEMLREFRFDLVIHGHKHVPRFTSSIQAGRHALSILCAGSFSRRIDTAWTGLITNQFHVIETLGRDGATAYLRGEVRSWAYQPRSWVPSDKRWSGIRHKMPFGTYSSRDELIGSVRARLGAVVAARTVVWSDVIAGVPEIEYAEAGLVHEVLTQYAEEINAILFFDIDFPANLALVRR